MGKGGRVQLLLLASAEDRFVLLWSRTPVLSSARARGVLHFPFSQQEGTDLSPLGRGRDTCLLLREEGSGSDRVQPLMLL